MIIPGEEKYKTNLMQMWKICFGDSDEFIRFYFEKVYRNEDTLIALNEKGLPVAALQMIPYRIKINNQEYNAGYISGAMTDPDYRRQGHMERLLHVASDSMKKRGDTFSFLIPQEEWLIKFYAKYDYERAFPRSRQLIVLEENKSLCLQDEVQILKHLDNFPWDDFIPFYVSLLSRKENVILKNEEQIRLIVEDLMFEGGLVFYIRSKGFAFVLSYKGKAIIKEILFQELSVKDCLLHVISNYFDTKEISVVDNHFYNPDHFSGMVKILDSHNYPGKFPNDVYMNMMLD